MNTEAKTNNLVRLYAHKWMQWYLDGDGSYDGHNWNSHRTIEEKNAVPHIVWDIVGDAVQLLQLALDNDDKRSYNSKEWSYIEFIITGERPRVVGNKVKYHFWNLYTVLKLTDEYMVQKNPNYNNDKPIM